MLNTAAIVRLNKMTAYKIFRQRFDTFFRYLLQGGVWGRGGCYHLILHGTTTMVTAAGASRFMRSEIFILLSRAGRSLILHNRGLTLHLTSLMPRSSNPSLSL